MLKLVLELAEVSLLLLMLPKLQSGLVLLSVSVAAIADATRAAIRARAAICLSNDGRSAFVRVISVLRVKHGWCWGSSESTLIRLRVFC